MDEPKKPDNPDPANVPPSTPPISPPTTPPEAAPVNTPSPVAAPSTPASVSDEPVKSTNPKKVLIAILLILALVLGIKIFLAPDEVGSLDTEKNAVVFLKTNQCGVECDNIRTIAKEYAGTLGIGFQEYRYDLDVAMPGVYMLLDNKISVLAGVSDRKAIAAYICDQTNNKEICTDAGKVQKELLKNDLPIVDLFVMSHCPYGLQMEKGLIPVLEQLGDRVHFNIRFVYYAMHGETEIKEQLVQYCIQKESQPKLREYLKCFIEAGKGLDCVKNLSLDETKLSKCVLDANTQFKAAENLNNKSSWLQGRFPLFNVDQGMNKLYDVKGSPTLVVNGYVMETQRDPNSLLKTICGAFNTPPAECNKDLGSIIPGPGFGWDTEGTDSAAACS